MPAEHGSTGPPFDRVAFEALYRRVEGPMYNVVYRWVWQADDAHEVVQEAFLRLWRMRARVRAETVEPLVYRIALNLASNRRRAAKLRRWVGLDRVAEQAAPGRGAEAALGRAAEAVAVRRAIERLPEKLRRVVMLCGFSELSYAEVAEALGIAPGTVASRRHAALARLEGLLAEGGADGDAG